MASEVQMRNCRIHSLPNFAHKFEHKIAGREKGCIVLRASPNSKRLSLMIHNVDNGKKKMEKPFTDTSLSWLLKLYRLQHTSCHPDLRCQTKYLRVIHQGRMLFHSTSGKKTLLQLGVKENDEIVVGGGEQQSPTWTIGTNRSKQHVEEDDNDGTLRSARVLNNGTNNNKKKVRGCKKKKMKQTLPTTPPRVSYEQLMEKYRQEHSQAMTPVLEQLGPKLKDIRNELNALKLRKSAPKVRKSKTTNKNGIEQSSIPSPADDATLGGKAGKTSYPILVGEESNLYKTVKSLASKSPIVIDLHGNTREEASERLGERLPSWIDTAMKGEYPWVIPVDIICGGGNQILAEVVQKETHFLSKASWIDHVSGHFPSKPLTQHECFAGSRYLIPYKPVFIPDRNSVSIQHKCLPTILLFSLSRHTTILYSDLHAKRSL